MIMERSNNRSFSSVFRLLRFPMKRERKLDGMEGRREISKLAPIIVPLAMVHPPTPMMNGDLDVPSFHSCESGSLLYYVGIM